MHIESFVKHGFIVVCVGMLLVLTGCDSSSTVGPDPEQFVEESESLPDEVASRDWVKVPLDSLIAHGLVNRKAMKQKGIESIKGMEKYTYSFLNTPSSAVTFSTTGTYQAVDATFELDSFFYEADYIRWTRSVTADPSCASSESLYFASEYFYISTYTTDPFAGGLTLDEACDYEIEASSTEQHYFSGYGWMYESGSTATVTADYQPPFPAVTVSGPSTLDSGQSGTWTANVNFGSGSTTYQWSYRRPNEITWRTGGTGSSYTHTFYAESGQTNRAEVKVNVTRSGQTESDNQLVYISTDCADPSDPSQVCPIL